MGMRLDVYVVKKKENQYDGSERVIGYPKYYGYASNIHETDSYKFLMEHGFDGDMDFIDPDYWTLGDMFNVLQSVSVCMTKEDAIQFLELYEKDMLAAGFGKGWSRSIAIDRVLQEKENICYVELNWG